MSAMCKAKRLDTKRHSLKSYTDASSSLCPWSCVPWDGVYTDEQSLVFEEFPVFQQPPFPGCVSLVLVYKLDQRE